MTVHDGPIDKIYRMKCIIRHPSLTRFRYDYYKYKWLSPNLCSNLSWLKAQYPSGSTCIKCNSNASNGNQLHMKQYLIINLKTDNKPVLFICIEMTVCKNRKGSL